MSMRSGHPSEQKTFAIFWGTLSCFVLARGVATNKLATEREITRTMTWTRATMHGYNEALGEDSGYWLWQSCARYPYLELFHTARQGEQDISKLRQVASAALNWPVIFLRVYYGDTTILRLEKYDCSSSFNNRCWCRSGRQVLFVEKYRIGSVIKLQTSQACSVPVS